MENLIIEQLIAQGIFATLFIWLFMDNRKDTKDREKRYQETINKLSTVLHNDIVEIKNKLNKRNEE